MSPETTGTSAGFTATTAPALGRDDARRAVVLPAARSGARVDADAARRAETAFPAPSARASGAVSAAVFSPLPRDAGALRARSAPVEPDPFAPALPGTGGADDGGDGAAQRSRSAGYAAGWAQGVAAAAVNERAALAAHEASAEAQRDALRRAFDRALAALDDAAAQMRGRIVPTVDATADVLVAAAADLAEMLVGHELTDSQTRGRRALERALAAAPEHSDVVVSLHPLDLQLLEHAGVTGASASSRGRTVQLTGDGALHPGDAVAHFPGGQVDARVSTAMARLRSSLRSAERAAAAGPDTASHLGGPPGDLAGAAGGERA